MNPLDMEDADLPVVNLYEYYRTHGLDDLQATKIVLYMLLTRTHGLEIEARECAAELNIFLPYVSPGDGNTH